MVGGTDYVWGNMAWNAILITALGYMIKRWMDDTKGKIDKHCTENSTAHIKMEQDNKADHNGLYGKIDDHEHRITKVETHLELTK